MMNSSREYESYNSYPNTIEEFIYYHCLHGCLYDSPEGGIRSRLDCIHSDFQFDIQNFYFCITGIEKPIYNGVFGFKAEAYMTILLSLKEKIEAILFAQNWISDIFILYKNEEKQMAIIMSPLANVRCSVEELADVIDRLVQDTYEKKIFKGDTRYRNVTSLCGPLSGYKNIRTGYHQARHLNDLSFLRMDGTIFTPNSITSMINDVDYSVMLDSCMNLRSFIDAGDKEQALKHLQVLFLKTLRDSYNLELIDNALSFLHSTLEIRMTVYGMPLPDDSLCRRNSYHRVEECVQALSKPISMLCDVIAAHDSYSKPVLSALYYIHRHTAEYFVLEDVARYTGTNPSYLSARFSTETGMSMRNYITRLRMEEAQKLLLDSESTVAQIASAVGYDDVRYFTRLFKQHAGCTPTEYRITHKAQA